MVVEPNKQLIYFQITKELLSPATLGLPVKKGCWTSAAQSQDIRMMGFHNRSAVRCVIPLGFVCCWREQSFVHLQNSKRYIWFCLKIGYPQIYCLIMLKISLPIKIATCSFTPRRACATWLPFGPPKALRVDHAFLRKSQSFWGSKFPLGTYGCVWK